MAAKTYKEKEERIPFQEDVNVNLFFPGAQRKELVDDVLAALHDEVTFLSISGEEGTGKTMICRIVEKEIADRYMCVYVPENIESFENVIGLFSGQVGLSREISQKEVAAQEEDLILFLREKKQRLVIIFDNAEKMYLAMLERLRKLLDRMNGEETLLQIILSGRRVLYENLEQLEICEFKEIEEIHFHLSA
ncbi:MAG: AAA family ATPase, partial [Desulfocapsaceae bacterium]|nr:AAA family ATPase [Desulfocapsaceae bacterium]